MILVVGATGEVGTAVVRRLVAAERPVRAFVRPTTDYDRLADLGVELAFGDLRDRRSVAAACEGVTAVIATATATVPRRGDRFESIEDEGYGHLVDACEAAGVEQFVFLSVPVSPVDSAVPTLRYKRSNEHRLQECDFTYTIVRASLFMDDWLALLGSSVPVESDSSALKRPFWFSRLYRRLTGRLVENWGVALVPGTGGARHSFVAVADVAAFLVACVGHSKATNRIVHFGGPEALSWDEAVGCFERVLDRRVRRVSLPSGVLRVGRRLLAPVSEGASNIVGLLWFGGTSDSAYDPREGTDVMPGDRTSVEEFLRARAPPAVVETAPKRPIAIGTDG